MSRISIPLAGFTLLALLLEHCPSDVDVGVAGCYVVVKCFSYMEIVFKWLADVPHSGRAFFGCTAYRYMHPFSLTHSHINTDTQGHTYKFALIMCIYTA
jgi:hypothetical protein